MFSILTSKIFGGTTIVLAIFSMVAWVQWGNWKEKAEAYDGELNRVVAAVQQGSGNADVERSTVIGQILAMGESNRTLKIAIVDSNRRIDDMAQEAVRLRAKAGELQRVADKARAQRAAALKELSNMKIAPKRARDCQQLVTEAETALDLLYQQGF